MRSAIRYIPMLAVAVVFAACGEHSSSPTAPAVPELRREESGGLGVGGSATGGNGSTTDPNNTTQTVQTDTTDRGGGLGVGGS